jgi:hypothetical protein
MSRYAMIVCSIIALGCFAGAFALLLLDQVESWGTSECDATPPTVQVQVNTFPNPCQLPSVLCEGEAGWPSTQETP